MFILLGYILKNKIK